MFREAVKCSFIFPIAFLTMILGFIATGCSQFEEVTSAEVNDIRVQVIDFGCAKIKLRNLDQKEFLSKDDYTWFKLRITNMKKNGKIDYTPWYPLAFWEKKPKLKDNFGNTYKDGYSIPDVEDGYTVDSFTTGLLQKHSLYPGDTIEDMVFFEKSVDGVKRMFLSLPATNIGGNGLFVFQLNWSKTR